jgi:chromosome segregation ATPase
MILPSQHLLTSQDPHQADRAELHRLREESKGAQAGAQEQGAFKEESEACRRRELEELENSHRDTLEEREVVLTDLRAQVQQLLTDQASAAVVVREAEKRVSAEFKFRLDDALATHKREVAQLEGELEESQETVGELQGRMTRAPAPPDFSAQVVELKSKLEKFESVVSDSQTSAIEAQEEVEALRTKLDTLSDKLAAAEEENESLKVHALF